MSPRTIRRFTAAGATLGLVSAPLLCLSSPASAAPAGDDVVINEAYVNGTSAGAVYKARFFELYNPTASAVSLTGTSLQYRGTNGTTNSKVNLTGTIAAHGYFLVSGGTNTGGGADLPAPDQTTTLSPAGAGGTVFLANTTDTVAPAQGSVTGNPQIVDLLGYSSNANSFEGTPGPSGSVSTSLNRTGFTDTDDNGADFTAAAPTPTNGAGDGGGGDPTPTDPIDATIAQVQGTTNTSPHVGDTVHTTGVVTAAYKTGGFNGFYIQTAGTGGNVADATPNASDAVYVYGSAVTAEVAVGDAVDVTGKVSEFNGLTEVTPAAASDVTVTNPDATEIEPEAQDFPRSDDAREALEGMLLQPEDDYTVTDNYATNQYAEIGLARGDKPLIQPTDVADAQDKDAIAAVVADNAARAVTLDDGSSINFLPFGGGDNQDIALPYLEPGKQVRVGANVDFVEPVVLDFRNNAWKFQPTRQVTDEDDNAGTDPVTFEHTRTNAPEDVGGDVQIASFNVLNYFTTLGADNASCSPYVDRDGNPVTVSGGCDPRGAWDPADLTRQQDKIVKAINSLDADVVNLMEIENSLVVDGPGHVDEATQTLVSALNAQAGAGTWDYVHSPNDLPPAAQMDVINNAMIYRTAAVSPHGPSHALGTESDTGGAFDNAREPIAQAFVPTGGTDEDELISIVNHFKSKGSGTDDGTGQGNANPDRVRQAEALVDFADAMKTTYGTDKVFLAGDFNSYSMEDPIQVLTKAGYVDQVPAHAAGEYTYQFDGMVGSLDHILASPDAEAMVNDADVWNINSVEPLANEYSRYNYNAEIFYEDNPFRSSDHDPVIVGVDNADVPEPVDSSVEASSDGGRYGQPIDVDVTVTSGEADPSGDVRVSNGDDVLTTGTVGADGTTTLAVPALGLKPGTYDLTVDYLGNDAVAPSSDTVTVRVKKALSTLEAKVKDDRVRADRTKAEVKATVTTKGFVVDDGEVVVKDHGEVIGEGAVQNGKAVLELAKFRHTGKQTVAVKFKGSRLAKPAGTDLEIKVVN